MFVKDISLFWDLWYNILYLSINFDKIGGNVYGKQQ